MIRSESHHELAFPREKVWPLLSNTEWLNRSMGLPPVDYRSESKLEGGSEITAHARILGREMQWREMSFEWLEPEDYRAHRVFQTGPFLEARMGMQFEELPSGRTHLMVYSELTPRNALGTFLARRVVRAKAHKEMRRIVAHIDEFLRGHQRIALPKLPAQPVNETALEAGLAQLRKTGEPAGLVDRLGQFLRESPDVELSHIRPLGIARRWNMDPWIVLHLFLNAPRCGLLDLRWEVLCPNCRSTRAPITTSLSQLKSTSHCDVCQIKFDSRFDQSVELKFAVHPGIRARDDQTFCLAGPGGKPHVFAQLVLAGKEERVLKLPANRGSCRIRSPQVREPLSLVQDENRPDDHGLLIACEADGFRISREPRQEAQTVIRFRNPNSFSILVSLENAEWSDEILTAARITNWQPFRELLATEVISPTESVTIGSQVVLFTDLRGSTAMYQGLGDAAAYAVVRNHFTILQAAVRGHHGTIVKTIGDAAMAAFSRVDEALAAVRQMHQDLPTANPELKPGLALKSSLHVGPCLAVNANDRLDYFGTTVNLAARMVDCCKGGDLTVSDDLFHRPEMASFVSECAKRAEPSEVQFRGFDSPHRVWRIPMVIP